MRFASTFRLAKLKKPILSKIFFVAVAAVSVLTVQAKDCFVYFGTFTDASSQGIYVSRLDMDTGVVSPPQLAIAADSPNYLAISPDSRFLYAANRATGKDSVSSFSIDPKDGHLKLLDTKSSGGNGPCYVGLDVPDHCIVVANYAGGSVKSFHLNADGTLVDGTYLEHHGHGTNPDRQQGPHAHCFVPAPDGRFALCCDLGLDQVMIYKINPADAALTPNDPPFATIAPGSGPRHLAFSPDGKTACVVSEMACTVTVFDWDGVNGKLTQRQSLSLLPEGQYQKNFTAAEIAYRPDGRFVYATTRTHNSISVLAVDATTGNLSLVQNLPCGGDFPRGMGIDPSGHWLIVGNQKSRTATVFAIDPASGHLTPTGQVLSPGDPVDVKFASVE
jgi:6-phosphogluconolactonase